MSRRAALAVGFALLASRASAWPERPIRLLHGFAPGGAADTLSRLIATPLSESLGQPVIVEPRPGAGGNIATAALARAPADGHTLGLLTGGHAVNAAFGQTPGFDPVADFDFIALITRYAFVIAVRRDNQAEDLAGLLAAARARPGQLSYGSAGTGSTQHLVGEMLNAAAGVRMIHVPYRGDAAAITALLGGELTAIVSTGIGLLPHLRDGTLRALAVSSARRSPLLLAVPTVAEASLPGFEAATWAGLAAPRGLPAEVATRLHASVAQALAEPALRQRLEALLGGEVEAGEPGELGRLVASEIARWRALIEYQKIRLE